MFPYDGYLALAKKLASDKDEARLRSAVSRAYYACFHLVKGYAEKLTRTTFAPDARVHKEIIDFLNQNIDADLRALGSVQTRLRYRRADCDYQKTIANISGCAQASIKDAESIFSKIKVHGGTV
ncbi:MAG: hypothetical protein AAB907_04345 [Patescibacteria group bacterium]